MRLKNQGALLACVLSAGLCTSALGQVTGTVLLDGQAPQRAQVNMAAVPQCAALHANPVLEENIVVGNNNELANVVVSLKSDGELKGAAPQETVVLDQRGCQYFPHVVAAMVGQPFVVKNDDAFLHNVHGLPLDNQGFNFAQPNKDRAGKKIDDKLKQAERFSIKCDVHPWMLAHVSLFEHPYFAVSNEKGEFTIPTKGLADGKYTLVFWQETFNEQEGPEVEVKDGKAKLTEPFKMKQEQAAGNGVLDKVLGTALLSKTEKSDCDCCEGEKAVATAKKEKAVAKAD